MEERRRRYEKKLSEDSHLFRGNDWRIPGISCFFIWLLVLVHASKGVPESPYYGRLRKGFITPFHLLFLLSV